MGFENQDECFCGTADENLQKHGGANNCENGLGGRWSMDIYLLTDSKVSKPPSAAPSTQEPTGVPTLPPTYSFKSEEIGCFRDRRAPERLFQFVHPELEIGLVKCADLCFAGGFPYMGYEDTKECFCGLDSEAYDKHGSADNCGNDAAGNGIGGGWAMSVYRITSQFETAEPSPPPQTQPPVTSASPTAAETQEPTEATPVPTGTPTPSPTEEPTELQILRQSLGCWKDTEDRIFSYRHSVDGISIDECQQVCFDRGDRYMGRQYQVECYCGTETEGLTFQRNGESDQCENGLGGSWSADVYRIFTSAEGEETFVPSKSPVTSIPTKTPVSLPVSSIAYTSLGCWRDDRSRSFDFVYNNDDIGLEACAVVCNQLQFTFMGYQDGKECYCGSDSDDYQRLGSTNNCVDGKGGGWAMDVYQIQSTQSGQSSGSSTANTFWQYLGCFQDKTEDRVLPNRVQSGDGSIETCAEACRTNNLALMGLQSGQCYCGPVDTVPDKHGVSQDCEDGLGGNLVFDAYFLTL